MAKYIKDIPFYKRVIRRLLVDTAILWNDEFFLKMYYWCIIGKSLNLKKPQTFCEKINWLKIHHKRDFYTSLVDKIEVKKTLNKIISDEYIIPTIDIYDNVDEIDFEKLPNQFVLKCSHDSGGIVICRNKDDLNFDEARHKLNIGLRRNFFKFTREYPYKNVKPRIIAEELLEDDNNTDLKDYKFFCFNGKALYCQLISNRSTRETVDFYDRYWVHQEFVGLTLANLHESNENHPKPNGYDKMLEIADKLATFVDCPFVRIDLYNVKGKIYFGEITFYPASGMGAFYPDKWNYIIGNLIVLPR